VWTSRAVELMERVRAGDAADMLALNVQLTDANGAVFDVANQFHGCIAGIHEILRRQGLLEGIWCLDPREGLSAGQAEELDRVTRDYPHLTDDVFVRENLERWLNG
jgi:dihydrodipicolinate synthase/N-acetylneuraminate lyase